MNKLKEFENILSYEFNDIGLLKTALTHSSYANEHLIESNERMEFLGDAVLELCMSKYLYSVIDLDEGVLTKSRAKAVCEDALNVYAKGINLSKYIFLGKGEECSGGRERPAIIADAFEAVLGAVFLDGGINEAYRIVENTILPNMGEVLVYKDYKSILQRYFHQSIVFIRNPSSVFNSLCGYLVRGNGHKSQYLFPMNPRCLCFPSLKKKKRR